MRRERRTAQCVAYDHPACLGGITYRMRTPHLHTAYVSVTDPCTCKCHRPTTRKD